MQSPSLAGVVRQDLAEVVGAPDRGEAWSWVGQEQQRAELGGRRSSEGLLGPRDVGPAELPEAAGVVAVAGGVERVEVRAWRRVDAVRTGVAVAGAAEVGRLDAGQVGLERHPAVVAPAVERRAGEQDRPWVQPAVLGGVGQRPRPGGLVGHPVEVVVGAGAAADLDAQRLVGGVAADVVTVRPALVRSSGPGGACGRPLRVMKAKFAGSMPTLPRQSALLAVPVFWSWLRLKIAIAAHHLRASQLMPFSNDTQ